MNERLIVAGTATVAVGGVGGSQAAGPQPFSSTSNGTHTASASTQRAVLDRWTPSTQRTE